MATKATLLTSTIGRKLLVSLTGLFLIIFLVVHASGNFQLFLDDGGESFNKYTYFMTHNGLIKAASYILYAGILVHIIWALALAAKNRAARPVGYKANKSQASWASKNMAPLGIIILVFLVVHLANFWYHIKFGTTPMVTYDGVEYKDAYGLVESAFQEWWIVALYLLGMVALFFHLKHGFWSSFQTLGLEHKRYTPVIKAVGLLYSILIPAAFASMPLFFVFKNMN